MSNSKIYPPRGWNILEVNLKEVAGSLTGLSKDINSLYKLLNIEDKKRDIIDLEKESLQADFWNNSGRAQEIMRRLDRLKRDVNAWEELQVAHHNLSDILNMSRDEKDETFIEDIQIGIEKIRHGVEELKFRLRFSDPMDIKNAIIVLHSGAGGTEACDWTEMLLRMYRRWSEKHNFTTDILDILPGEEAGIKSVTLLIKGDYVYGYLKSEIGIHRLVRISPFDANKRRHTSFASCDVIPEVEDDINVVVEDKDIRIDTFRASGHGGQHVNKTDSAVRITHIPTGIVVQSQSERSQHKNKAIALKLLRSRLYELEMEKKRKEAEKHYNEKGEIAWGNQIRSYVFCPYTKAKDHRTNVEVGNIQAVMDGDIDIFIHAYLEKMSQE